MVEGLFIMLTVRSERDVHTTEQTCSGATGDILIAIGLPLGCYWNANVFEIRPCEKRKEMHAKVVLLERIPRGKCRCQFLSDLL